MGHFDISLATQNGPGAVGNTRPNIIVFLVDDLGWQDTSVPFWKQATPLNKSFCTPNMERMAAEGLKFKQAYAAPVCTPSRVSLVTGLSPARHKVSNWTQLKDKSSDVASKTLVYPDWRINGLCPVKGVDKTLFAKALPQVLREAGYRTIHIGKAHFGAKGTPGSDPLQLGFDINIGGSASGHPGSYSGAKKYKGGTGGFHDVQGLDQYHGRDVFLTEALTLEAIAAMDGSLNDKKPFFLHLSHYAVHTPHGRDQRFFKKYIDQGMTPASATYAALVEGVDKSLGDITAHLEKRGITKDTIILFVSDNGGLSAHSRDGAVHSHNAPLKSGKGSAYEGGIRVPMMAKWPGVIQPGTATEHLVIIEDFFPSIIELAGINNAQQEGGVIDGKSFVPILKGKTEASSERILLWHYPHGWGPKGPGLSPFSAIRKGDYKLIFFHDTAKMELYNIAQDISEVHDLSVSKAEVLREMSSLLKRQLESCQAQMPVVKKTGKIVQF